MACIPDIPLITTVMQSPIGLWLCDNREWLFGGVGIYVIGGACGVMLAALRGCFRLMLAVFFFVLMLIGAGLKGMWMRARGGRAPREGSDPGAMGRTTEEPLDAGAKKRVFKLKAATPEEIAFYSSIGVNYDPFHTGTKRPQAGSARAGVQLRLSNVGKRRGYWWMPIIWMLIFAGMIHLSWIILISEQ